MGVLVIDAEAKERISKLKEYAESNEMSLDDLLDIYNDPSLAAGRLKEHNILLYNGYRVVYTIEHQPKFKARHISISLNNQLPPVHAAQLIIDEFGFENSLEDCHIYEEPNAINIIEPI